MIFRLLVLLPTLLLAFPALAWNKPGPMVTGAIAYDVLAKDDPAALKRVIEILKAHPQWDTFARRLDSVPAADRDRYLFMIAARWADDVRDDKTYHRGNWHYVNYPVFAEGAEGKVTPPAGTESNHLMLIAMEAEAARKGKGGPKLEDANNILSAIGANIRAAHDGSASAADRAVAVCWLLHLIGDLHQPLHTVALFSPDYSKGDKGGNDFFVRAQAGGAVINLHQFWDGLLIGSQSHRDTGNLAKALRLRPDLAREKLRLLEGSHAVDDWFRDSVVLGRDLAYKQGTLRGGVSRADGPALPAGYAAEAKRIAEMQAVMAGYRLADVLREAVGSKPRQ